MKTIKARYNCGYWIWDCPNCNAGNRMKPKGTMAICGECYQEKDAVKTTVINSVEVQGIDKDKQDMSKRLAYSRDEVYKISFPKYHSGIEDILRVRKEEHQSWEVGETIEDLLEENKTHPKLTYIKLLEGKEKKEEIKPVVELVELDDKTLRRIG